MQFSSASILPYVAFNKDAFPQPPAQQAGWTNQSARRNWLRFNPARVSKPTASKPSFSKLSFQAQNQAFVRFAVASSAALKSHRAQY